MASRARLWGFLPSNGCQWWNVKADATWPDDFETVLEFAFQAIVKKMFVATGVVPSKLFLQVFWVYRIPVTFL